MADNTNPGRRGCRYLFNLVAVFMLGLVLAYNFVIPAYIGCTLTRVRSDASAFDPAAWGLTVEDVTLTSSDNISLAGWYVPSRNGAAIIAIHGSHGNRSGTLNHAALLAKHGYGVLMLDLRGHGSSGGEVFTFGWDTNPDIQAGVDFLQSRPEVNPSKIGALGLSMGAEVVLQAAADDSRIKVIIADGTGFREMRDYLAIPDGRKWSQVIFLWTQFAAHRVCAGVTPPQPLTELLPRITPRPVLLIAGGKANPIEMLLNDIYGAAAGENAVTWQIPEAGHVAGITTRPDDYETRVIGFLNAALAVNPSQ